MSGKKTEINGNLLNGWITRVDLAKSLCISESTLARWASTGIGPPYVRIGRRVVYRVSSVEKWLERMERKRE